MTDTSSRAARTPAAHIRAALVAAGRKILEEEGPTGLTVRAVAGAAGVAPMGVYNHFEGKNGLLDAVVTDGFREFATIIAATDADPTARLAESGRGYRRFAIANPTVYSLMFAKDCNPDVESATNAFEVIVEIVRYGQTGGVIRDGDPNQLAMNIWSCVHGAVSLELATPQPPSVDMQANYESVIALIGRGIAP
ncbi:WHG domain-containing protein [Gordonia sp. HY002]|uniref:TetR/AcrR family transcriptional regulator n=1 Tax=Gordonia zhenghanii TaxID=2911516 RepID=UPI001EF0F1FA|nr:TetR-like C-terminal domain-containing protein [Gordonia zhenghanii]MCF8571851.1 WHG domain-containing protein [Gordonia zhenghanii]MCF8604436.1 WHG domain-containing protein [Gordonia zhenghanii]